jgi:hypothetical protein
MYIAFIEPFRGQIGAYGTGAASAAEACPLARSPLAELAARFAMLPSPPSRLVTETASLSAARPPSYTGIGRGEGGVPPYV